MPHPLLRRTILFCLFVTVFAASTPPPAAGAQREKNLAAEAGEMAGPELFSSLVSFLRRLTNNEGCNLGPNGRCISQNTRPQTKEGCHIDPWGRCLP
jgi:hypothetical protein